MPGRGTDQVALISASAAKRARFIWTWVLAIGMVGIGAWIHRSGNTDLLLLLAFFALVAGPALYRARRLERWMRDPVLGERLNRYRAARDRDFAEACAVVEKEGTLIEMERVIMVWSTSWFRRQWMAHYRADPFEVIISERDGRVGSLLVIVAR